MQLKPEYYVLGELLSLKLFRIPNYQRTYSWEKKQRSDLFNDIKDLHSHPGKHHFMATIVCLNKEIVEEFDADEYSTLDIVDGQQRLTTLIILLKALAKNLNSKTAPEKDLKKALKNLLVKGDDRLILLQTNHDLAGIFSEYIKEGKLPDKNKIVTHADLKLQQAFNECEQFVEEWRKKHKDIVGLLKLLKNRLGFIFYTLNDEGSVYTVFEVLNSRGLEVDWLDKCKSMLMGIAFDKFKGATASEHIKTLHTTWSKIYHKLGTSKIPGHEILRFAATLKQQREPRKTLSSDASYEFFKDYCLAKSTNVLEVGNLLYDVTLHLESLYSNRRLSAVTNIAHARLLAVSILHTDSLNKKERTNVLSCWERVSFKIFGLSRKDARTGVGDYVRLACGIHKKRIKTEKGMIEELNKISKWHPIDLAIEDLKQSDCYGGWEGDLRYFFYRYEEHLCKLENRKISPEIWGQIWSESALTSIEHIHPQTRSPSWRGKLGRGRSVHENNVHRLGNLVLLPPGVNSECGQKSFKEKKKIYKKNSLRMHEEIIRCKDWTREQIEDREKNLLEWAKATWSD